MEFEAMEERELFAADLGMDLAVATQPAPPAVVAEIDFVEVAAGDTESAYLKYKLERAFVKSWSTSGDADDRPTEEVAFYYNKIGPIYAEAADAVMTTRADGVVDSADFAVWQSNYGASTR